MFSIESKFLLHPEIITKVPHRLDQYIFSTAHLQNFICWQGKICILLREFFNRKNNKFLCNIQPMRRHTKNRGIFYSRYMCMHATSIETKKKVQQQRQK